MVQKISYFTYILTYLSLNTEYVISDSELRGFSLNSVVERVSFIKMI